MQLELEGRTRAELEDVLQRIERHYRSEQAVRRRAEESEREAAGELARERELRVRLEEEVCAAVWLPRSRGLGGSLGAACGALPVLRLTCACAQLRLRCAETKETDALRASLEAELAAVEEDVKRVEVELSAARSEVRCEFLGRARSR